MAATKGNASLLSLVTTGQTSAAVDTSTYYAMAVYAKLAVLGTPTGSATFSVWQSPDGGTTYYPGPYYSASLVAGNYYWEIAVDPTCTNVKVDFTAQSGGTSGTFTAQLGYVSGV